MVSENQFSGKTYFYTIASSIHSVQENSYVLSYLVSQPKTDEIDTFWLGLIETTGNENTLVMTN